MKQMSLRRFAIAISAFACASAAGHAGWRVFFWTQVWTQIVEYGPPPDRTSGHAS